ncbi:thiosulfate oxidation carrier complex protein SoxZ [Oharaeibacter diazotrophicus]|uniref:Sulfur compound chelating protein SoxZ n=1 Tax=Oharaeibacter diazotrophicus TaxID=1920512 RepID=A0A4R6RI67_9HYPH|nr:thiosulfate oxidation carrier complex protein SoxZ [Oharaeibacter diazotrophicus]TDP86189.1 sulfur compound chelating protein SoxZ [Oharaeibacter diazotrophicus]BBE71870.1 sulfur oxidation protein SoxZ [Pleomorphomonas sp. SM30]GLS78634.1 thiosulfate oxidation carrier complex protein SoxZ [Oharaeibacter diazotrophicus]
MSFGTARLKLPARAARGETVTVRALVGHPMESGFRKGDDGRRVPRLIVARFVATLDGEEVFACDLEPAMAANPYFEFDVVVSRSGLLRCVWTDDLGAAVSAEAAITVD